MKKEKTEKVAEVEDDVPETPEGYKALKEGKANILYIAQKLERDEDGMVQCHGKKRIANEINENRGAVFYNPVQEFNRDISLTVIREFNKIHNEELAAKQKEPRKIKILEALAATGLRSVRYLKEIDNIEKLCANDWDPKAVELMEKNLEFNNIEKSKYKTYSQDAVTLMN